MTDRHLTSIVEALAQRHGVPGASVAIVHGDDQHTATTGVTCIRERRPVDETTLFQVGSITKVLTASLILKLVQDRLLSLDHPLHSILPNFAYGKSPDGHPVTIEHILTHTPGFDGDWFYDSGEGDQKIQQYLSACDEDALPWFSKPGETWSYCNAGYVALGGIIENTLSMPWEQAIRSHIFEPFEMYESTFFTHFEGNNAAVGHRCDGQEDVPVAKQEQLPAALAPAGSTLLSTPLELSRFARAFFEESDSTNVELDATVRESMSRQYVDCHALGDVDGWGYGWSVINAGRETVLKHSGHTIGQRARLVVAPASNFSVCITCNGGDSSAFLDEATLSIAGSIVGDRVTGARRSKVDDRHEYGWSTATFRGLLHTITLRESSGSLVGTVAPTSQGDVAVSGNAIEMLPVGNDMYEVRFEGSEKRAYADFPCINGIPHGDVIRFGKRVHRRIVAASGEM